MSGPTAADVIAFLDGRGELDGVWFTGQPEGERGAFWWRKYLPLLAPATLQVAQPPELRERTIDVVERALFAKAAPSITHMWDEQRARAMEFGAQYPGYLASQGLITDVMRDAVTVTDALIAAGLIATSAVDGREIVERCASILDAVIAEGYRTPANKVDTCEHGKYGWEDCIACYDEALTDAAARMRALSSGGT